MDAVEIKKLNKWYGKKQALYDVSLSIGPGMFGLLGRNGAGKTTLMKILATLIRKKSGEVSVCGVPVENAAEVRRLIGYLPQEFSMYPSMKVGEALEYLAILAGLNGSQRKERVGALLERVNLTEQQNKKVKSLSGGMKRRLGIAQALLGDPKVLIVDEPTAGLDLEERVRFRNLLSEVAENKTVLLSTHIVGDIEAACEDIAILEKGRVIFDGTVERLLEIARGKVFCLTVAKAELPRWKGELSVTGMHAQGNRVCLRFFSNTPPPGAEACAPNIEDAYLLYLCQNGSSDVLLKETGRGA